MQLDRTEGLLLSASVMKKFIISAILLGLTASSSLAFEPYIRHLQRTTDYKELDTDYKEMIRKISPSVKVPTQRLKDLKMYAALIHPRDYENQYWILRRLLFDDYFMENTDKFTCPHRVPKDVFEAIVAKAKTHTWGRGVDAFWLSQIETFGPFDSKVDYLCREVDAYRELLERKIEPQVGSYAKQLIAVLDLP